MITLGIIADTHIPDRRRRLSPAALDLFDRLRVQAILHAGDISEARVLDELGEIAPVYAVRGNRDWGALRLLPRARQLDFGSFAVGLAHGHGSWWNYFWDKGQYFFDGYSPAVFERRLLASFPQADVIVYGHTHRPVCRAAGRQLIFNPGSALFPRDYHLIPSVGLLRISGEGRVRGGKAVEGEIVYLE